MAADDHFLNFTDELLTLVQDTRATTTYKYALLLAIIDLIEESAAGDRGTEILTTSLTTQQIAAKVIELYWRQTLGSPMFKPDGTSEPDALFVPKQSKGLTTTVDHHVLSFRLKLEAQGISRFNQQVTTPEYTALLLKVEDVLVRYPIPLLQQIGGEQRPLIYFWPHKEGRPPGFQAYQRQTAQQITSSDKRRARSEFSNVLRLAPNAPLYLTRLAPLLRPFIQEQWATFVAKKSGIDSAHDGLLQYLFGSERESLKAYRTPLINFQNGTCFYCCEELKDKVAIDHFIPWSRTPNNAVENLVAAHSSCNARKSDHFAGTQHLKRWRIRLNEPRWNDAVNAVLKKNGTFSAPARSLGIARSHYLLMQPGRKLWVTGNSFEDSNPEVIQKLFNSASN